MIIRYHRCDVTMRDTDERSDSVNVELPVRPGQALPGGWSVENVQGQPDSLRYDLIDDRTRVVVLIVRPGLRSGSPFRLSYEPTTVPFQDFEEAGRALVRGFISAARGGDVGRFFQPGTRSSAPVRMVLAAGDDPIAMARRVGPARLVTVIAESPFSVTAATTLVEELVANGVERVVLRSRSDAFTASSIEMFAPFRERLTVQAVLVPDAGAADPGSIEIAGLEKVLAAGRAADVVVEACFVLTRETAYALPALAGLVLELSPLFIIVLEVPGATHVRTDRDAAVSLAALGSELPAALRGTLGNRVRLRSEIGTPLCIFPGALMHALFEPPRSKSGAGGSYGSSCERCGVRQACGGLAASYATPTNLAALSPLSLPEDPTATPEAASWEQKVRWLLVGHPGTRVTLKEVLPPELMPRMQCTLPWTRLELHEGGSHGPCCLQYGTKIGRRDPNADAVTLWNGPTMQKFRRALLGPGHPSTCRTSCPVLVGGQELPQNLQLRGGPARSVENQLQLVRGLIEGRVELDTSPTHICFATTSYCNYDCLMCLCGEIGTLDDEKPASFYASLRPWFDRLLLMEVNGGEPLASPEFRSFLESFDATGYPQLGLGMTTNGSYLTPSFLARQGRLPFDGLTISINAATSETYLAVNRGLSFERIRGHLAALLALRRQGQIKGGLKYSMVILRQNLSEIRAFADQSLRDRVDARFMLEMGNRNGESIMTDRAAMTEAMQALGDVAVRLEAAGRDHSARDARAGMAVLRERLARGILRVL